MSILLDIRRYGLALIGPVGSAGTQFLLLLVLLSLLDTASFGRFAFLLVAAQFCWAIWHSLFCAPLPHLLSIGSGTTRPGLIAGVLSASLCGTIAAYPVLAALAWLLGEAWLPALLFAAFATAGLLRWFARALAYAQDQPRRAAASDIVYAVTLLIGTGVIVARPLNVAIAAYAVLFVAMAMGMIPFGMRHLRRQAAAMSLRNLRGYRAIWADHSRWSLLGVVASEVTANAHAYFVSIFIGAAAFAPIAASGILVRPATVATSAIIEFERARLAMVLGDGAVGQARRTIGFFRAILILVWCGTAAVGAVLLWIDPPGLYPLVYDRRVLMLGAVLWMVATGVRMVRSPEATLLQALGAFRPLALTGIWSAAISCVAVLGLLFLAAPIWSILGIILGESVAAILLYVQGRKALRALSVAVTADGRRVLPAEGAGP